MKAIDVDPERRRTLVEPGVVWRELDDAAYVRLVALKRRYDPDNVFRLNHNNVDPDAAGGPEASG